MDELLPPDVISALLCLCNVQHDLASPEFAPASTLATAFQRAQDAALAAGRLLMATAATQAEQCELVSGGLLADLAFRCAAPELARCVDDMLVVGFAESIADRIVDHWQDCRFTDHLPPLVSDTCSLKLQHTASDPHGIADAAAAAYDAYVQWLDDDHFFDPQSQAAHDVIVPEGRLAAFDVLAAFNRRSSAAVMAGIIAESVWRNATAKLGASLAAIAAYD